MIKASILMIILIASSAKAEWCYQNPDYSNFVQYCANAVDPNGDYGCRVDQNTGKPYGGGPPHLIEVQSYGRPGIACAFYNCAIAQDVAFSSYLAAPCGSAVQTPIGNAPRYSNSPLCSGSIIQLANQVVGESIPLAGVNWSLNYFSNWVIGRKADYAITLPLTSSSAVADINSFDLKFFNEASVQTSAKSYLNVINLNADYLWNGLDNTGNVPWGPLLHKVKIITKQCSGPTSTVEQTFLVGSLRADKLGLGSWVPSVWHYYSVVSKKLFGGDGRIRSVQAQTLSAGGWRVAEEDGSLVYDFDSEGKQVATYLPRNGTQVYGFSYDGFGRLTQVSEPFGRNTVIARPTSSTIRITSFYGVITNGTLSAQGYLASLVGPLSLTYQMTYSAGGLMATFQKPNSAVSTFTYDEVGNLSRDAHSGGYFADLLRISYSGGNATTKYTSRSGLISTVRTATYQDSESQYLSYPDGTTSNQSSSNGSRSFGSRLGMALSESLIADPRFGNTSTIPVTRNLSFNGVGRSTNLSDSFLYTTLGSPFSLASWTHKETTETNVITSTYTVGSQGSGSLIEVTSLGRTKTFNVDMYGRLTSAKIGSYVPFVLTYANEKLATFGYPGGLTTLSYNVSTGNLSSVTDPYGQITYYTFDAANRLTFVQPPIGVGPVTKIALTYDGVGNLSSITPRGKTAHTFGLNTSEHLASYNPPLVGPSSSTLYTYDNDNRLKTVTRPDGLAVAFNYNTVGQLTSVATPAGNYTNNYGYVSVFPSSRRAPSGYTNTITWNGNLLTEDAITNASGALISRYRKTWSTYPRISADTVITSSAASAVSYTYDQDEFLMQAGDLRLSYGIPSGSLTQVSIGASPSNLIEDYTYNTHGALMSIVGKYGGVTKYSFVMTRDVGDRVTTKTQVLNGVSRTSQYVYDSNARIKTVTGSTLNANYLYDDNGNRNGGNIGTQATVANYDVQDRLINFNALSFTYNVNGDLMTKSNSILNQTTAFVYDVMGNLTQVTLPNGDVISYAFDSFNRRIAKSINGVFLRRWSYADQARIVAEIDGSGNIIKRFVYGSGRNIPDYMIMGGVNYKIISDDLGSPRLVINVATGVIAGSMDHDEFGREILNTAPNLLPFGFAGGIYDVDTGLVRFGARDYDPYTGRWTSKDPIRFGGGDTNLYGYVMNDPVNLIDPLGLAPGDQFHSPGEAAGDALIGINPVSISVNREHGGYIYGNSNGTYSATRPIMGSPAGLTLGAPPAGAVGDYHTHGAYDPMYYNEGFSFTDIWGNAVSGLTGYLATPGGTLQQNAGGSFSQMRMCPK